MSTYKMFTFKCFFINPFSLTWAGPVWVFCIHLVVNSSIFNYYGHKIYRLKALKLTLLSV